MQATSTTPDLDAVVSEIAIAAPRERVFQALTDATQLKCWFSDPSCPVRLWEMDARPGRAATATSRKKAPSSSTT